MENDKKSLIRTFIWLAKYIKPYRVWFWITVASFAVTAAIDILIPYSFRTLTDIALSKDFRNIWGPSFYLLLAVIIVGIFNTFLNYFSLSYFVIKAMKDLRAHIVRHIQMLPISSIDKYHSGDFISRLNNDTELIRELYGSIATIVYQPLIFLFAFTYAFLISWKLLLATMVIIPAAMLLNNVLSIPLQNYMNLLQKRIAESNSVVQDAINGIHIIKAYNLGEIMRNKYKLVISSLMEVFLRINKRLTVFTPIGITVIIVPMLIVSLLGGYLTLHHEMSVSSFLVYIYIVRFLTGPINVMNGVVITIRRAKGAADRILEILEQPIENTGAVGKIKEQPGDYAVEFKNVSFSYQSNDKSVLDNLCLQLPRGKTTALVGMSGSGKSTVLKLLCKFYEPQEGCINLWGKDLAMWSTEEARGQISLVSQDSYIFPVSIAENIRYGKAGATQNEIIEAAKVAFAHDFIMEMPDGYNTVVGERGNKLSGGQKQRIAIARAVLKNGPILLLDEPTSALDVQSEMLMTKALECFTRDRTVLVIAHRLSTIIKADEVIVLAHGCIAEKGTHEQLIAKGKLYYELYLHQFLPSKQKYGEIALEEQVI